MIATLAMYDWPQLHEANDRLWGLLRDELRVQGIDAPNGLDRTVPAASSWLMPELLLGQTCGLPYREKLASHVQLLGAPDYGLPRCGAGFYRSAWIARADDPRSKIEAFSGSVFAFNDVGSQSGWAARPKLEFGAWRETGAHLDSVKAVADGVADMAAIDAVSWRLAVRYEEVASKLKVVGWSQPTPGLPLICSNKFDADLIRLCVAKVLNALPPDVAEFVGIQGFVAFEPDDYLV